MREKIIIFAFFLGVVNSVSGDVCQTPECKDAASEIMRSMDSKVAPCDNFYNFACGNFIKSTVIPKDQNRVDKFDSLNEKINEQLRTVLEEKIQLNEPKFSKLAKNYYQACINTAAIEKKGLQPILDDLKAIGGWPVLPKSTWNDKSFDWINATYILRNLRYGTDYLFSFGTMHDSPTKYFIDQPSFGLNREFLVQGINQKYVQIYNNYLADIAVILGADRPTAEKEMKESLEFEIALAKISMPENKRNDPAANQPMKVKEFSEKYPGIPWKDLLNKIHIGMMTIRDDDTIIVGWPPFFKEFEKLIKQNPKKTVANYLGRRAVDDAAAYLSDKIRNRQIQFMSVVYPYFEKQPRWKVCLQEVTSLLQISVNALYVRRYLTKDTRKSAADLVAAIKTKTTEILKEQTDWMDEKTKKTALEKIDAIVEYIGNANELLDDKKVDGFYNNLEITSNDDYLRIGLNTTHVIIGEFTGEYRIPSERTLDWTDHSNSLIVNISYTVRDNSIEITAGALQGFLFNKDRPMVMNFAALGNAIASTMADSFLGEGKQYDKSGKSVDWWQPETKKKFAEKADCIVQQYNKYTIKELGLNLNGDKAKEDNIADNKGLKTTYLAYQDWVKQHGEGPTLPELKQYSQTQIFWIATAQTLCTKYTKEGLKNMLSTTQSPTEFIIRGTFSNMPEFAKDFKCPAGSNMNPVKKCTI